MLIYKITRADDWLEAVRAGVFAGSAKDREDGFVHFSTAEQLEETLKLHYARVEDMLAVSAVEASDLAEGLRWESSRNGDLFPHLYGPLPMTAVRATVVIFYATLAADGFASLRDFVTGKGAFAPENPA